MFRGIPVVFASCALLTVSFFAHAEGFEPDQVKVNDRVTLQGLFLPAPQGAPLDLPPFILLHGLTSNIEPLRPLARFLNEKGHAVAMYNARGHGNGPMRSRVREARKGDYGFRRMVVEDVPAVVEHVYARTGRPVILLGHSMGGMKATQYASGVHETVEGALRADSALAMERTRYISGLITGASPVHFREIRKEVRWLSRITHGISRYVRSEIPSWGQGKPPTEGWMAPLYRLFMTEKGRKFVRKLLGGIPQYILNVHNMTDEELAYLAIEGLSPLHADIGYSFNRFALSGYASATGFSYEETRPIYVPILALSAEQDELAKPVTIWESVVERNFLRSAMEKRGEAVLPGQAVNLTVSGFSHGDLLGGRRGIEVVGQTLVDFARDPRGFVAGYLGDRLVQPQLVLEPAFGGHASRGCLNALAPAGAPRR